MAIYTNWTDWRQRKWMKYWVQRVSQRKGVCYGVFITTNYFKNGYNQMWLVKLKQLFSMRSNLHKYSLICWFKIEIAHTNEYRIIQKRFQILKVLSKMKKSSVVFKGLDYKTPCIRYCNYFNKKTRTIQQLWKTKKVINHC